MKSKWRDVSFRVSTTICISCCEPMPKGGNSLSRNPNVCASCASMLDGDSDAPEMESTMRLGKKMPQDKPLLNPEPPYDSGAELVPVGHHSGKKRR